MTRKFETLKEIEEYAETGETLYVRWSGDPEGDTRRGYSKNYATGETECGLSVNNLCSDWLPMSRQITEYQHSMLPVCCLMTGEYVGRGSDNEPLIINAKVIGIVTPNALAEAHAANESHLNAKVVNQTIRLMTISNRPMQRNALARMVSSSCGCFVDEVEAIWAAENVNLWNVT